MDNSSSLCAIQHEVKKPGETRNYVFVCFYVARTWSNKKKSSLPNLTFKGTFCWFFAFRAKVRAQITAFSMESVTQW